MIKPHVALYARCSTSDQKTDSQRDILRQYAQSQGWNSLQYAWYIDHASGKDAHRTALDRLRRDVERGTIKTVAVVRIDRLSRMRTEEGLQLIRFFAEHKVRFISVTQNLEISGAMSEFVITLLLAVSAMERALIVERIKHGLESWRKRNPDKRLGRKPNLERREDIRRLQEDGLSLSQIASRLGVSRQSIHRMAPARLRCH